MVEGQEDDKESESERPGETLHLAAGLSFRFGYRRDDTFSPILDERAGEELDSILHSGLLLNDRYLLENEIGRGGMGITFLARDTRLERSVVIKVMRPPFWPGSAEVKGVQREVFIQEARLASSVSSPAIAALHDFGFHQGNPFAVFEYISGENLRTVLGRRERIPFSEVLAVVPALVQALDSAHGRQIVHLDLKPENILVTEAGRYVILDLGLAKQFSIEEDRQFAGTPAYASPEQAAEKPSDGRTDQYALALIIYEMISGRLPFEASDPLEFLEKHRREPPALPETWVPDLPAYASEALLRALRKDPAGRFPTCEEFATALGCSMAGDPGPTAAILRDEVRVGPWTRFLHWPFGSWTPGGKVYVSLAPNGLWTRENVRVHRWPLATVNAWLKSPAPCTSGPEADLDRLSKKLHEWREEIDALASSIHSPEPAGPPEERRVFLVRRWPRQRTQLLGPVEGSGESASIAQSALAVRAAQMGADAVIGILQEVVPGSGSRLQRHAGSAVRALDENGWRKLAARWFSGVSATIAWWIILFCLFSFVARPVLGTMARVEAQADPGLVVQAGIGVLFSLWPLSVAVLLRLFGWPELLRPSALALAAAALAPAIINGFSLAAAAPGGEAFLLVLTLPFLPANCMFAWLAVSIARSALRARREYFAVVGGPIGKAPIFRRLVGCVIHGGSSLLFASCVLMGAFAVFLDDYLSPHDLRVHRYASRGDTARQAGRYTEAIQEYSRAIELGKPRWQLFAARGDAHQKLQAWEPAIQDYSKALEGGGTHWSIPYARGCARWNLQRWEEAAEDFSKALASGADDPQISVLRGDAHSNLSQWVKAAADYSRAIESGASDWKVLGARGDAYFNLGRSREAIADYSRALDKEPSSWRLVLARGDARAQLGRTEEAVDDYSQAVRMAGGRNEDLRLVHALDVLAASSSEKGDKDGASSFLEQGLAIVEKTSGRDSPDAGLRLEQLSRVYLDQAKHPEAERCARRAISIWEEPPDPDPFRIAIMLPVLAAAYAGQSKHLEAVDAFRAALSSWAKLLPPDHPNLAIHLDNLAAALRSLGRNEEAEEYEARGKAIRARAEQGSAPPR